MRALGLAIAVTSLLGVSCSTVVLPPVSLNFFSRATPADPWHRKIENWQARHRLDPALRGEEQRMTSDLGDEYRSFSRKLRRRLAADTVAWVQEHSRKYFRPDGQRDHWATLGEVIEAGGDDCDGLDLLTFVLLRRVGFKPEEIYRAIVSKTVKMVWYSTIPLHPTAIFTLTAQIMRNDLFQIV